MAVLKYVLTGDLMDVLNTPPSSPRWFSPDGYQLATLRDAQLNTARIRKIDELLAERSANKTESASASLSNSKSLVGKAGRGVSA
jgi:hypothetical protein